MDYIRITEDNIDGEHICCAMSGKQSLVKKEWLRQRFAEGLVFYRSRERGKCFIEYIPAEYAWVPIQAEGYLYINCLWVSGSMKGHGYSNDLLAECIRDAKAQGRKGLCTLSAQGRKREFLSDPKYLAHKGLHNGGYLCMRDRIAVSASCFRCGAAEIQGLRQTAHCGGERLRALLHGSVSLHLLLGAESGGGGQGASYSLEGHPCHQQGSRRRMCRRR